jgi:putative ABC transport system substrate-binding protein
MTQTRRQFVQGSLGLAGLGLVAGCGILPPQLRPKAKVPRIGYLSNGSFEAGFNDAFTLGLRELGYVEGQNVIIESRFAEGKDERLPDLAAELVRLPVDVIVTSGSPTALAAQRATETIPIVSISGQPVETGMVASQARPNGNLTGLSLVFEGLRGKKVELLKEAIPGVTRVGVLSVADNAAHTVGLREFREAAEKLGIVAHSLEIRDPESLESAFEFGIKAGVDALILQDDPFTIGHLARIVDLEVRNRLPTMHGRREFVDAGGLMAHGVSFTAVQRRAATYVDKILKGAKPGDLPIEQPTTFDFVVNLKTAQALGLSIPPSVLQQATEVIQ